MTRVTESDGSADEKFPSTVCGHSFLVVPSVFFVRRCALGGSRQVWAVTVLPRVWKKASSVCTVVKTLK